LFLLLRDDSQLPKIRSFLDLTIVLSAMQSASGDYHQAAKQLGIHVNNLHRLIRELKC